MQLLFLEDLAEMAKEVTQKGKQEQIMMKPYRHYPHHHYNNNNYRHSTGCLKVFYPLWQAEPCTTSLFNTMRLINIVSRMLPVLVGDRYCILLR
jgi:hypothetical protein